MDTKTDCRTNCGNLDHKCRAKECFCFVHCQRHKQSHSQTSVCKHVGCDRKINRGTLCKRHRCGYRDCSTEVDDTFFCLDHCCTFPGCHDSREYSDDPDLPVTVCGRHYCASQGRTNRSDYYCSFHMCIGQDAGCKFPETLPLFLAPTYSEGNCPSTVVFGATRTSGYPRSTDNGRAFVKHVVSFETQI